MIIEKRNVNKLPANERRATECCKLSMKRSILPTSNLCERFFSMTGYALNDRRRGILQSKFELQMFFHANSHSWGLDDVNAISNE